MSTVKIMTRKASRPRGRFGSFLSDRAGTILVAFAIMLPILVGSVGMSMDIAESYLVRQRLGGTIDAAALAATASETDPTLIAQRVAEFFAANYTSSDVGTTHNLTTSVSSDGSTVTVSAYADYNTTFMRVLGIDKISVYRTTTVQREVQGLEVVMVLDNTGSMADANKIGGLQTAATDLVNILFQKTDSPDHIKIGMVPYANAVRVGLYGLGYVPDPVTGVSTGTAYGDGTPFVTLPSDVTYAGNTGEHINGNTKSTDLTKSTWYGCVEEHNPNAPDDTDVTEVSGSKGQLWTSSEHPYAAHGWDPSSTSNETATQDEEDNYEGPWDVYQYGTVASTPSCSVYNCKTYYTDGNTNSNDCTAYYTDGNTNHSDCYTLYNTITPPSNCGTFYTDGNTNSSDCQTKYTDGSTNPADCETQYSDANTNSSDCQVAGTATNGASCYTWNSKHTSCTKYACLTPKCQTEKCEQEKCQVYNCQQEKCQTEKCQTKYSGNPVNGTTCQTYGQTVYSYTASSQPNQSCPYANIQPMVSDQTRLLEDISTMQPNGDTRGDIGIMWGYRMISPDPPFTEGSQWGDKNWRKAIIMMTDGMNTRDGTYAGDWFMTKNTIGPIYSGGVQCGNDTSHPCTDYNQRFLDICNALKAQGVTIYTVIFGTNGAYPGPDDATKSYYQQCATDSTKYFDSESNSALDTAFQNMANQLANLHISQ